MKPIFWQLILIISCSWVYVACCSWLKNGWIFVFLSGSLLVRSPFGTACEKIKDSALFESRLCCWRSSFPFSDQKLLHMNDRFCCSMRIIMQLTRYLTHFTLGPNVVAEGFTVPNISWNCFVAPFYLQIFSKASAVEDGRRSLPRTLGYVRYTTIHVIDFDCWRQAV